MSPDGKQLYVTSATSGMLWIVDRPARTKLTSIPVGGTPRRIAFDASGATAAVTNEAGFVTIIR
jgi:YVTN family beta-propeller protein